MSSLCLSLGLDSAATPVSAPPARYGGAFTPPEWAVPLNQCEDAGAAMHIVKDGDVVDTLKLDADGSRGLVFGRAPSTSTKSFTLHHATISRTHAALLRGADGTLYVLDLGSFHGTFCNNVRITPFVAVPLGNGSALRFGQSTRTYLVRIFPKRSAPALRLEEEEANTLQNCMVGYFNKEETSAKPPASSLEEGGRACKQLERRVSFSCLSPQIILFKASCDTPREGSFDSPPEATRSRKKLCDEPCTGEHNKRCRRCSSNSEESV